VVEQSKVTQHRVPALDFSTADQPRPLSVPASIKQRVCDLRALYAFALYLTFSIIFFGRALFGHLSDFYFGIGVDPGLMVWSLVWWPHAIAHRLNPLLTNAIWAPSGFNLAWSTTIALASLLASPFTLTFGPVATYNILCLISLPIDAFCAFLLCRYIAREYAAALLGGYIFGFSAFMLGQLTSGHLHMMLVFPVPLCVYLVLRRLAGEISSRKFALLLSLMLAVEFLLSLEIFATMTMFGALALLLTWSFSLERTSENILGLLTPIACAYGIALIAVSPYLYYLLAYRVHIVPLFTPAVFSADPLNFLVPTPVNELGRLALFKSISAGFVSGWTGEAGAYLSLPLILIAILYVHHYWAEPVGKLLTYCLGAAIVLSFGPILRIYIPGHLFKIVLPWWALEKLPLLENVQTVRFSMYAFLVLAVIAACYFASDLSMSASKFVLAAAVVLFTLPNTSAAYWVRPVDTPRFFQHDIYRKYLSRGEAVLILPYAYTGNSMMWQAQTHMYFDMAEGTTMPPPSDFRRWPIFRSLTKRGYVPDPKEQFEAFAKEHHVTAIIVTDGLLPTWQDLLSRLDSHPVKLEGVCIYRLPRTSMPDVEETWRSLRTRFDTERLTTLITGSEKYLSQGGELNSLSVSRVEEAGLIPLNELVGPPIMTVPGVQDHSNQNRDPHFSDGVWIGRTPDGLVAVGEEAWYVATKPLLDKLRGVSSRIYFPYPSELRGAALGRDAQDGWLMLTFTRAQLAQAAALLSTRTSPQDATSGIARYGHDTIRQ
jgi:hypothetical protein